LAESINAVRMIEKNYFYNLSEAINELLPNT